MTLAYGFVKAQLASQAVLKPSRHRSEIQYHLHFSLLVNGGTWDVAVNVGTSDSDDLLKYKLVYDFRHPIIATLAAAQQGPNPLTASRVTPAMDFCRSDVLVSTGAWRDSDVMDGSSIPEPVASLKRLLARAMQQQSTVYVFGRFYETNDGVHDTHMNQGSTGSFLHTAGNDANDHNDVWQDGALLVDLGDPEWAGYFAAFNKQLVPTDDLGNPTANARAIGV